MTAEQENDLLHTLYEIRDLLKKQIELSENQQPSTKITVVGGGGKGAQPSLKGIDTKADFIFGEEHN